MHLAEMLEERCWRTHDMRMRRNAVCALLFGTVGLRADWGVTMAKAFLDGFNLVIGSDRTRPSGFHSWNAHIDFGIFGKWRQAAWWKSITPASSAAYFSLNQEKYAC
jgi:hypothetical protein